MLCDIYDEIYRLKILDLLTRRCLSAYSLDEKLERDIESIFYGLRVIK